MRVEHHWIGPSFEFGDFLTGSTAKRLTVAHRRPRKRSSRRTSSVEPSSEASVRLTVLLLVTLQCRGRSQCRVAQGCTPAAGRSGGGRWVAVGHMAATKIPSSEASVRLTVLLLVECLGVECAGRSCDAGENRQGDQSRYDGLHGYYSRRFRQHLVACHRMIRMMARRDAHRCLARDKLRNIFSGLGAQPPPNRGYHNTIDLALQVKAARSAYRPRASASAPSGTSSTC